MKTMKSGFSLTAVCIRKTAIMAAILGIAALGSVAYAQDKSSYLLGPEDLITVSVLGHPEFSGDFFIPTDGIINLPAAGNVSATGKSLEQMAADVAKGLEPRLRKPEVTVSLRTPRMQRIYVVGAVSKSGSYDMKPGWRITEALAAAGGLGIGINPEDCKVIILRAGTNKKEEVALSDVLRGSGDANLEVNSGDNITIDPGETLPVYVAGKVKTPGLIRVRKDNTNVMSAIAMAGGMLEESSTSNVKLTHLDGTSEVINLTPAIVEGKEVPDVKLQAGDQLVVPEATARIAVLGFVGKPGFYTLRDGIKVTLTDALGMAEGMDNKRASLTKVAVVRTVDGKEKKMVYDLKKFLKKGDTKQNPVIMAGDVVYVPETDKFDWDIITRSVSAIGVLLNPLMN